MGSVGPTVRIMLLLTAHQIDPGANAHLLARLHHLERLVEQDFASKSIVDDFNNTIGKREAPPRGVLLHADAAAEGQFYNDAATQGIRYVVVPKGKVALCGIERISKPGESPQNWLVLDCSRSSEPAIG